MSQPIVTLRTQSQAMAGWLRLVNLIRMRSWDEIKRDELAELFPSHDIWTVRHATCRHTTWCSRPKGHGTATINAGSADELQAAIAQELQAQAQAEAQP